MRFCPSVASRRVIKFTAHVVPVVFLTACGGGTESGSQDLEADLQASTLVPTSSLTDAAVLESDSQSLSIAAAQQALGTSDSVDESATDASVQLGMASPVTEPVTDTLEVPPAPIETSKSAVESETASVDAIAPVEEALTLEAANPVINVEPVSTVDFSSTTEPEEAQPVVNTTDSAAPIEPILVAETDESEPTETTLEPVVVSEPEEAEPVFEPASAIPESSFNIGSNVGDVTKLITDLEVSASQTNVQQTPIAVANGYLYTANIEHGPRGDVSGYDLETVIRQGTQDGNGDWTWQKTVVEDRTINDKWHTAPSIEVDKQGLIHVVYNLHNFPWQYKRSTQPHDLSSFQFYGQYVTDEEIRLSAEENKTSFPTLGKADIPGNQVTYPAFFKDRNNDLYLSYRFGATPKQSFADRTMSSGVAVYNSVTQTWQALGGQLSLTSDDYESDPDAADESIAVAAKRGWTNYHPRLVFDQNNKMFISWFWRSGTAGAMITKPCLISSSDRSSFADSSGNAVLLPMEPDQCGNLGYDDSQEFYSVGNTAINNDGEVHIVLSPDDTSRQIVYYDSESEEWRRESSPYNATEIFFDADDTMWAIASDIRIYKRTKGSSTWQTVYEDTSGDNCYPRATLTEDKKFAFIHAEDCDYGAVTVYGLRLK